MKILYAIAKLTNNGEDYLREECGDDCYTDDIGNAIISDNISCLPELQPGEYFVIVEEDEESGILVKGKLSDEEKDGVTDG